MLQRLRQALLTPEALIIASFAILKILFHLLLPEYGYHRDEMYYVAIADGFSFSNLDMPPASPLYLKLFLVLFGHSLKVVHLAAAVSGACVITFGILIARELGGKRYAMILTGAFLLWSGLAIFGSIYTYDDVSFVLWAAVLYLVARMLNGADQRLWLIAGLFMGVGMLTKLTILFLGFTLFVSLWLVPQRIWYRQPWIWLAGVVAFLCGLPYFFWQWNHDWYFLSYAATYAGRTTHASPVLEFLWNQILPNNLVMLPVWALGLATLLFKKGWAAYRLFGYCYLVLIVTLFILGGQFYFMIPMYGVLVAAGSVRIEGWVKAHASASRPRTAMKVAIPVVYTLLSLPALPLFLPMLPVETLIAYVRPLGVNAGVKTEDRRVTTLPQHMADRFGWEEMARDVADVYHEVQEASSDPVGLTAGNWGEASALHVHGRKLGLPEPVTGDGWFYFDALEHQTFDRSYVAIGVSLSLLRSLFDHVERKGVFTNPYCMPDENNNTIYFCTGPKVDLKKYWAVSWKMDAGFADVLQREGVDQAVAYYQEQRRRDSGALLFSERQMNALGYQYLNRKQTKEALKLFAMNVETYPRSFNVYDSYGEALMADQQFDLAVRNYSRSLELNPENENGRKRLEELRVLMANQLSSGNGTEEIQ